MPLQYAHPETPIEEGNATFMGGRWYRVRKVIKGGKEIHLRRMQGDELAKFERRLAATNRKLAEQEKTDES